jgi:hypothetical protein
VFFNKELHDLYPSPNIMWVIKTRRMKWAEHIAQEGERQNACRDIGNT